MYDQSFKNQAVKECVNGQPLSATARKYDISLSALRGWIEEYKERMAEMGARQGKPAILGAEILHEEEATVKRPNVVLSSINVTIDGHDITMSKRDVVGLMEVFYQFDKREEKRDDV